MTGSCERIQAQLGRIEEETRRLGRWSVGSPKSFGSGESGEAEMSRGGEPFEEALRMLWSRARRFRCRFSVVGTREVVCFWSCQPSLSVSVASRAEPVSFQEHDLGMSPVHFSDVVLAFSVSWCRSMACGDLGWSFSPNKARFCLRVNLLGFGEFGVA
ncbi:Uncharacterized protein Rs2_15362 [Raphanus sativus]|nr:Uncharacterized protein Rs2_15362 [Raphanus sativus]